MEALCEAERLGDAGRDFRGEREAGDGGQRRAAGRAGTRNGRDFEGIARADVVEPAGAGRQVPAVLLPVGGVELKRVVQRLGQRGCFLFSLGLFAFRGGFVLRSGPGGVGSRLLRGEQADGFAVLGGRGFGGACPIGDAAKLKFAGRNKRGLDEALGATEVGERGEQAGEERLLVGAEIDVPANPERLAFAHVNEGVEDLGLLAVASWHVVAGVGGGGFGEEVVGRDGGELFEEAAEDGFVAAVFPEPRGEEGAEESPRAGRPLGHAFVDVGAPGGGVPAARGEGDLYGDHSKLDRGLGFARLIAGGLFGFIFFTSCRFSFAVG